MSTDPPSSEARARVIDLLRRELPDLIERSLPGVTVDLQPGAATDEIAPADHTLYLALSSGLRVHVRLEPIAQGANAPASSMAPYDDAGLSGCRHCGSVTPFADLNPEGACPDCAAEQWQRMTPTERAAWCKTYKVHYPFEDKGPLPPADLQRIQALLESHPFRFAKTMPKNPHSYTLRHEWNDVGSAVFEGVVTAIREHGEDEWFGTFPWRILKVGGFKYWSYYSSAPEEVFLINRKPLPPQLLPTSEDDA